ncbi:MAG: hypothetical protein B6I22_11950 [Desulfobacteraceae bacterium 4572_123]|nr:MAG: hypothetical protein B6I22_11950 [Desulfobacteraceae bacterium 4572_123]
MISLLTAPLMHRGPSPPQLFLQRQMMTRRVAIRIILLRLPDRQTGVAFTVNAGVLTLTNSIIRHSSTHGVRIQNSDPVMTDNTWHDNASAAVSMDLGSNPDISGVTLSNNGINGIRLDAGSLTEDGFWDDPDIVYWTAGDITVPEGMTLTMGAGQVVKFGFYVNDLFVNGALDALGVFAAPIIFTGARDDSAGGDTNNDADTTSPSSGNWGRIELTGSANVMEHVSVRYGGYSSAGMLTVTNGLINNIITNSSWGGIRSAGWSTVQTRYNDVYNPGIINYDNVTDATGQNGNISADPLYNDVDNLNYGLQDGSPGIDAGTSSNSPGDDYFFNRRYDHIGIANTGAGSFDYYDMGAIEFGGIPRVVKHRPEGETGSPVEFMRFTFRNRIDKDSFSIDDDIVSFTGPQGPLTVNGFAWINPYMLDVKFAPQYAVGGYQIVIGPNILDESAKPMDTDGDLVYGEIPQDRYSAAFSTTPPRISHHTPSGVVNGPVDRLTITFDRPISQASFDPSEDIAGFTGPEGDLVVTGYSWADAETLDIYFDPLSVLGEYTMIIGPNIYDLGGNAIDQNGNLIYPEVPGDQYKAVFTVADIVHVSGTIDTDTTWRGITIVDEPVTVSSEVTLTIDPDTIIKFDPFHRSNIILSSGSVLIAEGTVAQPVIFTSLYDDSSGGDVNVDGNSSTPNAGDWLGIHVLGGQAILDHVILNYGGGTENRSWNNSAGAIVVKNEGVVILSNSIIRDPFFEGILAWGSGTVTVMNSVITGADRGVNSDGNAIVELMNCTLDDNRIGIYGHNGDLIITNSIISNSIFAGLYNILSSPIDIKYSNVWSDSGSNYLGNITDQTGQNNNVSMDPQYRDITGSSYQLDYASPMIDAADGTVATDTDYMGAPRYDDPRTTNTGVVTADGGFPDMGAFEFVETAASNIDLIVSEINGPLTATAGTSATIFWTVKNVGSEPAVGPWHDGIYLVADNPTRDVVEIKAAEVLSDSIIGAGESADFESEIRVPGGTEGPWRWHVKVNVKGDVFEGINWKNNSSAFSYQIHLSVPALTVGETINEEYEGLDQQEWFKVLQPAGEEILITLDGHAETGRSRLYAGFDSMPAAEDFDFRNSWADSPDARLNLPVSDNDRTIYLMVVPETITDDKNFALTANIAEFSIDSINLDEAGNAGSTTVMISGSFFNANLSAQLHSVNGTTVLNAVTIFLGDSGTAFATFDLTDVPTGAYDVVLLQDGMERSLENAFTIINGVGGRLEAQLHIPENVRAGRPFQGVIEYTNAGDADLPVPLIILTGSTTNPVWLDGECDNCTWGDLQFLAIPTDMPNNGVLPPGKAYTILVNSLCWQGDAHYTLAVKSGNSSDIVDWDELKTKIWSDSADALWGQAWDIVVTNTGTTYGEYIAALSAAADEARGYGLDLIAVTDLLTYMVQRELNFLPGASLNGTISHIDTEQLIGSATVTAVNIATGEFYFTQTWYDGSFSFRDLPAGNYLLQSDYYLSDTWNEVIVPESGAGDEINISVMSDIKLSGRIISAMDKMPVEGAYVMVTSLLTDDTYFTRSDENGRYEVQGIPVYTFTVAVSADQYISPEIQTIEVDGATTVGLNLELESGGILQGFVFAADNSPVAGATVRALPTQPGQGKIVAALHDGSYEIKGLATGVYDVEAGAHGHGAGKLEGVSVTAGTITGEKNINLQAAGSVRFVVTDAAFNQPIEGASIVTDAPGYWPEQVVTDAGGLVVFTDLPPGDHTMWVSAEGYLTDEETVTVVGGEEPQLSISLRTAGAINGIVRSTAGEYLSDMPVTLFWDDVMVAMAWTGTDGAFGFHGLPDDEYTLALGNGAGFSIGRQTHTLNDVNNMIDTTIEVDIFELSGKVSLSGGIEPAFDIPVSLLRDGRLIDTVYTDDEGYYQFWVMEPDRYDVAASDGNIGFVSLNDIDVGSGLQSTEQDLTAGESSLSISVSAPSETTGNLVQIVLSPAAGWPGISEEIWFFTYVGETIEIYTLEPGDYNILVLSDHLAAQRHTVSVPPSGVLLPVILESGRTLQGTVRDSQNSPIPGALVHVIMPGEPPILIAVTDENGNYESTSLPAGSFDLLVNDVSHPPAYIENIDFSGPDPHSLETTLLDDGYSISGRVTDNQDHPLFGVSVEILSSDGVMLFKEVSGANGEYNVGPVAPGDYQITFHDWGLLYQEQSVSIDNDYSMGTISLGSPISIERGPVPENIEAMAFVADNSLREITAGDKPGMSFLKRLNAIRDYVPAMFGGRLEQVQGEKLFRDVKWMLGDKMPPPQRHGIDTPAFRSYYDNIMDAYLQQLDANPDLRPCNISAAYGEAAISEDILNEAFKQWSNEHNYLQRLATATVAIAGTKGLATALEVSLKLISWQKDWLKAGVLKDMINGTDVNGNTISDLKKSELAGKIFWQLKSFVYDPLAIMSKGVYAALKKGDWKAAAPYMDKMIAWEAGLYPKLADFMIESGLENELVEMVGSEEGKKLAEKMKLGIFSKIADVIGIADKLIKYHQETKKGVDTTVLPAIEQWWKKAQWYDKAWRDHREKTAALARAVKKCLGESFNVPPAPPGLMNLGSQSTNVLGSMDPNDKYTVGFGAEGFISSDTTILYTILFENVATATAAAQEVTVTDQLSDKLDWSTFQFIGMGFNKVDIEVPPGLQSFTREGITVATDTYPVKVHAELDRATGIVSWEITSVDPSTGDLPADPFAGFLPPNDDEHRGDGYLTFTIRPKAVQEGTDPISNQASIVFDVNPEILTPIVINTIDDEPPASFVNALPAFSLPKFEVQWSGNDGSGSGSALYTIYVQDNTGGFQPWLTSTTETAAMFYGLPGHSYAFYSIATDNAGHVEAAPSAPDATTQVALIKGDINGDGNTDLADAILALKITTLVELSTSVYTENEINGDNKIGIVEVIYILQDLAQLH